MHIAQLDLDKLAIYCAGLLSTFFLGLPPRTSRKIYFLSLFLHTLKDSLTATKKTFHLKNCAK